MAQYDLYIDTYAGALVKGPANNAPGIMPRLVQGDTVALRIYLLARTPTFPISTPYEIINNASLSLRVGIGPKDGTAGTTLITQQFTWDKSADNTYFYANLPLNTAAIASLIGSAQSADSVFEVEMTQGGYPTTVLQQGVTIQAEVIDSATIVTPPGATALTAEEANALFLKRDNSGFYLTNPTTGKKVFCYLGDDDSVHFDLVP